MQEKREEMEQNYVAWTHTSNWTINYRVVEVQADVNMIRRNVGVCEKNGHNSIRKSRVLEL